MSGWERELFPALEVWRQYRAQHPDRIAVHDTLWRAACWDATAKEHLAAGYPDLALAAWREARAIEDADFDAIGLPAWEPLAPRPVVRKEAA